MTTIRHLLFAPAIAVARLGASTTAMDAFMWGTGDACLVTDPRMTIPRMSARRTDSVTRHLHHLSTMIAACRYADSPAWSRYGAWITELAESHGTKC